MKLTSQELVHLDFLLSRFRNDPKVKEMKKYIQHGVISTYDHCISVTRVAMWMNNRWHLGADENTLIAGAFLHDFYLYDWHNEGEGLHGFYHPGIACRNAVEHFDIDEDVQGIIRTHMWPLTLTRMPMSREAWIVCMADKYISTKETLLNRRKAR